MADAFSDRGPDSGLGDALFVGLRSAATAAEGAEDVSYFTAKYIGRFPTKFRVRSHQPKEVLLVDLSNVAVRDALCRKAIRLSSKGRWKSQD